MNIQSNITVNCTIEQASKGQRVRVDLHVYFFFNLVSRRWLGGQGHAPISYTQGKGKIYPLHRRLVGSQDRFGYVREISPSTGIRSLECPSTASHYTYWASTVIKYSAFCISNLHVVCSRRWAVGHSMAHTPNSLCVQCCLNINFSKVS